MKASQKPRIDIYQPGDTERAELLFALLDEYGTKLYEWQRLVLRRWLAEDKKTHNFVNLTCGLSVPRQNGKTEIVVARIIYGIIFRHAVGMFTAQKQKTVDVVLRRIQDFFYENPHEEIFNLLTPRFRAKPQNFDFIEFQFPSGATAAYHFLTRTRLGGLGTTNDEVINDEAADMYDSHEETLRPTVSAAKTGNPQFIYCGTPPMAESVGEVFSRTRKRIMAGEKGCWTEWGVENFTDPTDKEAWYRANPSLGLSLIERAIESEVTSLSADGFNRMRLGWWAGIEDKRAISQSVWDACYTEKPEVDESFKPVYAVKFSPDRTIYCVAAALPLKQDNSRIHVEIVFSKSMSEGFQDITSWIEERWRKASAIIIDGATGAPILYEDLMSLGISSKKIIRPNMKEIGAAHEFIFDAIKRGEFSHYNQPLLNQTVRLTKQRQLGRYGGFGWESMNKDLSTAALDAATFAFWGMKVFGKKNAKSGDNKSFEKIKQVLEGL